MSKKLTEIEIDAELVKRGIYQHCDETGEQEWDEDKLYWARKMFRDGIKFAEEQAEEQINKPHKCNCNSGGCSSRK